MGPADQDSSLLARPAVGHRQHYGGDIVRLGLDRRPHTGAPPKTPLARPVSSAAELRHGGVPAPAVSGAFSAPHLTSPIQLSGSRVAPGAGPVSAGGPNRPREHHEFGRSREPRPQLLPERATFPTLGDSAEGDLTNFTEQDGPGSEVELVARLRRRGGRPL